MSDVRGESLPILYGRSTATGELVHVDDAPNGKACGCVCPDPGCGQPLIARNNGKKKIHHFAHIDGTCAWSAEYLLAKVKELTGGDSLDSNIQLVFNNARLAAQTAAKLCSMG